MKRLLLLLSAALGMQAYGQIQSGMFNPVMLPMYMGSSQGGNYQLPVVYRAQVVGLAPNTGYKYISRGITSADFNSTDLYAGAGNSLFMDSGTWKMTTSPNFSSASAHDTFWTNGAGEYEGWFGFVYTSDSRFTAGNKVYPYLAIVGLALNDTSRRYCMDSISVLAFGTTNGADTGTGLWGHSMAKSKTFVGVYDDALGVGRPLSLTFVENDGVNLGSSKVAYYSNNVEGVNGNWGLIIPNDLAQGIQKVENYDRYTGFPIYANTDMDGVWGPSNKNTVDPTGGLTAIAFDENDAALVPPDIQFWARTSTTSEGAGTKEVYVVRKYSNDKNSSVRLTIVGGTATEGSGNDYQLTVPKTITFTPGSQASDTTKITLNDDNKAEGDENIVLRLDQASNCVIGTEVAHTLTITDNDVAFAYPDKTLIVAKEDDGTVGIKIRIDKAVGAPSTLRLIVKKQGDSSYIPGEFRLGASTKDTTFTLGNSSGPDSATINATIIDDVDGDPHDTFIIALRSVSGAAQVKDSIITLVVRDNDGPSIVKFIGSATTVSETQSSVNLRIHVPYRTDAGGDFTLRLLTTGSTATQGADFTFSPSSKIINIDNNTPDTIVVNIPLLDDNIYEATEKIMFSLGKLSNVTIQNPDTFTITLINDDFPVYPIGTVNKQSGVNRTLDSANVKCRLVGTVYGGNMRTGGLQFTLIDNTGGISVISTSKTFGYTVTEKDSVMVQGTLVQNQGMAQIAQLDTIVKLASNRNLKAPVVSTDIKEIAESNLYKINRVKLSDPSQWPVTALATNSSKFIRVMHTSGVEDSMFMDAEAFNWHTVAAPTGYINITGIGGQVDATSPFTTGHYIAPRRWSDIEAASLPVVKFLKTSDTITELADSFRIDFVVAPLDENFTFDVVVKQATAVSPKDYDFNKRTIQVIKNNSVNPIRANISDDTEGDGPKDLTFAIRNIQGPGSIGADSLLYLYIKDNEANSVKKFAQGNIRMYPNPVSEILYIQTKTTLSSVEIMGADGRTVFAESNKAGQFSMDLSNISSGIYTVRVITAAGDVYSEPLIVK